MPLNQRLSSSVHPSPTTTLTAKFFCSILRSSSPPSGRAHSPFLKAGIVTACAYGSRPSAKAAYARYAAMLFSPPFSVVRPQLSHRVLGSGTCGGVGAGSSGSAIFSAAGEIVSCAMILSGAMVMT